MEILRGVRQARRFLTALALSAVAALPSAAQLPGASMTGGKWPIRTREAVDLWLHGFAMISSDTSPVPLFRRGYREALTAARSKASAVTDLDVNHDALAKRLRENPALVNAQFLVFSFESWEALVATIDAFVKADGDPKKAKSKESAAAFTNLARLFPAKADREFIRVLANALQNEKDVFFHLWWVDEMRHRERTLAAVDLIWQAELRPKLQGFLNHSQQPNGELILSPVIEGEGRAVVDVKEHSLVAVGFPDSPEHAINAVYAFAHEIVAPLTDPEVADNTTPAEKRSGTATTIGNSALVRGGGMLFAHLSPELASGYARYYLNLAHVTYDGDPMTALARAFPLPKAMVDAIERQLSISFGGI
jgi:hypothetical protein